MGKDVVDWYDWLSEHEVVRGGKVRLPGLPHGASKIPGSPPVATAVHPGEEGAHDDNPSDGAVRRGEQRASFQDPYDGVVNRMERESRYYADWARSLASAEHEGGRGGSHRSGGSGAQGSHRKGGGSTPPPTVQGHATYLIFRELRDMEHRISLKYEQEVAARIAESEARMRREFEDRLLDFERSLRESGALVDTFNGLRASNQDLKHALQEVHSSLVQELGSLRVTNIDC